MSNDPEIFMKIIGLLVCWILLFIFLPVLFSNIFDPALNWQDLLIYSGIGLLIYIVLSLVGSSLNHKFSKSIDEFVSGKRNTIAFGKGALRVYGLLIITLFPTLIYLLGLAVYTAITFSLYALLLISNADRVPSGLIIGIGIVAIGAIISFVISIYYLFFPPMKKTFGIALTKPSQPKLWESVHRIANENYAKPIDKIFLTPESGIGVYQQGSLIQSLFGKGERTLEIGVPSIHDLTVNQFQAILTHEYGHFSNKDTQWGSLTHAMGNSLLSAFKSMPGPSSSKSDDGDSKGINYVQIVMSLNPGYYILLFFIKLYFKITSGFSRIGEVNADLMAINKYGSKSFRDGLLKVSTNDLIFGEFVQNRYVPELLKQGKVISSFSSIMGHVYKDISEKDYKELENLVFTQGDHVGDYDSHPSLRIRVQYTERLNIEKETINKPAYSLFEKWEDLSNEVTDLYNQRLVAIVEAYAEQSKKEEQQIQSSSMPICPQCKRQYSDSTEECSYCGIKLVKNIA